MQKLLWNFDRYYDRDKSSTEIKYFWINTLIDFIKLTVVKCNISRNITIYTLCQILSNWNVKSCLFNGFIDSNLSNSIFYSTLNKIIKNILCWNEKNMKKNFFELSVFFFVQLLVWSWRKFNDLKNRIYWATKLHVQCFIIFTINRHPPPLPSKKKS